MGAIVVLIFAAIFAILAIVGIGNWNKQGDELRYPWRIAFGCFAGIIGVLMIIFIALCFIQIDAGEVGVQILFGRVLDQPLTNGLQGKSPYVNVARYSIRLNEYTMSIATGEGAKKGDDSIEARTKDNSQVNIDATIWWQVDPKSAFDIYKKVSQNSDALPDLLIRPASRTAMRDEAAMYDLAGIMTQRDQYGIGVTERLRKFMEGKGILIDKVLVRTIIPPRGVDEAIQAKLKSEQELQQKTFELQKAQKDAEIRIATAKGISAAQEIIQQKLTPIYVQYEAIQAMKSLAGSPNTTFYMIPMSSSEAGVPVIIGAPK